MLKRSGSGNCSGSRRNASPNGEKRTAPAVVVVVMSFSPPVDAPVTAGTPCGSGEQANGVGRQHLAHRGPVAGDRAQRVPVQLDLAHTESDGAELVELLEAPYLLL